MQLTKEVYRAFEDVVGPEYITQEPVILDSYNQVWGNKLMFGQKHCRRPSAVLLPSTTEEIQTIVKACNRYGVLFKAFSSGFEYLSLSLEREKGILLDLRRMNRILEINPENMYAVVEPFVSVYRLQLEAAKYGLYLGRIGVGYNAGVIAASVCHHEMSHTMISTSGNGRNVLGVEWVLPTGEILRLGSSEMGDRWYSAEGPGISLRGILRGRSGANGGHGVITKASIKLYPWYGPTEWEQTRKPGQPPVHAQLEKIPEGYREYVLSFPTMEKMLDATVDIAHAEIATALITGVVEGGVVPEGNDEEWAARQKASPEAAEITKNSVAVTVGSCSKREAEYREKVLIKIMEKWGGRMLPNLNEPRALAREFAAHIWSIGPTALRSAGDFIPAFGSPDGAQAKLRVLNELEVAEAEPYIQSGAFYKPMGIGVTYRPQENLTVGGSGGYGTRYDPYDETSMAAVKSYLGEICNPQGKYKSFGVPSRGGLLQIESSFHIHQKWGPVYENYDVWQRKIKAMLDPNGVADWSAYIPAEYEGGKDVLEPEEKGK
jgi:glycolate oxidase